MYEGLTKDELVYMEKLVVELCDLINHSKHTIDEKRNIIGILSRMKIILSQVKSVYVVEESIDFILKFLQKRGN